MQSTLEKIMLLKSASIFSDVSGEDLASLAQVAESRSFEAREKICEQGEVGHELYVIVSGNVAVMSGDQRLATLGPGETFGEMAVLDAEPRSATVFADEFTEVLAIGSKAFYETLHERSAIAEGMIRMLTQRLRDANRNGPA